MLLSRKTQLVIAAAALACVALGVLQGVRALKGPSPTAMPDMDVPLPNDLNEAREAIETRHVGDAMSGLDPEVVERRHRRRLTEYEALQRRGEAPPEED